jgi:5-methylcytosine-specific restriction endonuclease McrA
VTACSSCNHRKDDRLAEEVGRTPWLTPWVPSRGDLVTRRLAARMQ